MTGAFVVASNSVFLSLNAPRNRRSSPVRFQSTCPCATLRDGTERRKFEYAVESGVIVDRGCCASLNDGGALRSRSGSRCVPPETWTPAISAVIEKLLSVKFARWIVYAVYLRGSVAAGQARVKVSDMDFVVYCHPGFADDIRTELPSISQGICRQFTFVSKVDCVVVPLSLLKLAVARESVAYSLILQAFGLCVYGVDFLKFLPAGRITPERIAVNIMRDKRVTLDRARENHRSSNSLEELHALQWFIKRALRSCAELNWRKSRKYARDLVACVSRRILPHCTEFYFGRMQCYKICTAYMPEWKDVLTDAVVLSCVDKELWESEGHISRVASYKCVDDMACLVEHLFLQEFFPKGDSLALGNFPNRRTISALGSGRVRTGGRVRRLWNTVNLNAVALFHALARLIFPRRQTSRRFNSLKGNMDRTGIVATKHLVQDKLPAVILCPRKRCSRQDQESENSNLRAFSGVCGYVKSPTVHSGLVSEHVRNADDMNWRYSPAALSMSSRTVDVRVSPTNTVVFSRSAHALISKGVFTPTSVLMKMTEAEFIHRSRVPRGTERLSKPLVYGSGKETLYIQSDVPAEESILNDICETMANGSNMMQRERVWISTAGTVSSLHYDVSYSILAQICGCKRMIFFPPSCLDMLGIYPMGHPLHRRARVDITASPDSVNARLFHNFWRIAEEVAEEVLLAPGDVCVFPQGWAHYTESLTWSVSRTVRY